MSEYQIAGVEASPADQRDIPYRSPFTPEQLPARVDLRGSVLSVPDQLSIGSCVANGVTNQCEHIGRSNGESIEYSRLYLYTMAKWLEGRLDQEGLFPRDAFKIAYKYGIPHEADYPYDIALHNVVPPDSLHALAFPNRVQRYEAVVRPLATDGSREERVHRICSALAQGLTVGFAMQVTESLKTLTGPMESHQYELFNTQRPLIGGHWMVIVGYDQNRAAFIVLNSWGTDWGDNGYCMLPFRMVMEPFFEAWVVRKFRGYEIAEQPGFKFEFINRMRLEARYVAKPEEVGKKMNIWIGGVLNGHGYMRSPTPLKEIDGPFNSLKASADNWVPATSNPPPTFAGHTLDHDNFIQVVQWMNMAPFAGADIYIAIGEADTLPFEVTKLVTIPAGL